jgi:ubiquinone/menaquinone biosynthesis C-methylase UbiE
MAGTDEGHDGTVRRLAGVEMSLDADVIKASYDAVAEAYGEQFSDELTRKPFDCTLLDSFGAACPQPGQAIDVGCGPGHIARLSSREIGGDSSFLILDTFRQVAHMTRSGDLRRLHAG